MPNSVRVLENLLDYCSVKNKVVARNIANIGTENYKREDVVFKDVLDENVNSLLKTSNSKHLGSLNMDGSDSSKFATVKEDGEEGQSGDANLNIEREMAELAENTLRFKFGSKKVAEYYRNIQGVIKSGGIV